MAAFLFTKCYEIENIFSLNFTMCIMKVMLKECKIKNKLLK